MLKNDFSPKAVSKLMGHAKEIITVDVYGDNQNIIADAVLGINNYMEEVLPCDNAEKESKQDMQEICIDTQEYIPATE